MWRFLCYHRGVEPGSLQVLHCYLAGRTKSVSFLLPNGLYRHQVVSERQPHYCWEGWIFHFSNRPSPSPPRPRQGYGVKKSQPPAWSLLTLWGGRTSLLLPRRNQRAGSLLGFLGHPRGSWECLSWLVREELRLPVTLGGWGGAMGP